MGIHVTPEKDENGNIVSRVLLNNVPLTKDNRPIIGMLRSEEGYTVFPVGDSDDISNNTFGGGDELKFDKDNKIKWFQSLCHYYAIGGRVYWEDSDIRDYMTATLVAPATTGTQQTGDYNKVEVIPSSGLHLYVPTTPGTGSWDLDLTATINSSTVLTCTPVPVAGNTGFFDYDRITNTLTINNNQTGGYNLYDFDAELFRFARKIWGRKQDGAESSLEVPDIEGKLLYNSWKIKFELTIHDETNRNPKSAIIMITAVKNNI